MLGLLERTTRAYYVNSEGIQAKDKVQTSSQHSSFNIMHIQASDIIAPQQPIIGKEKRLFRIANI